MCVLLQQHSSCFGEICSALLMLMQRRQARLEASIDEHTSLVQRVTELELETSDMETLQQKAEDLEKQLQGKKVGRRRWAHYASRLLSNPRATGARSVVYQPPFSYNMLGLLKQKVP
jgi:hypothetical protein